MLFNGVILPHSVDRDVDMNIGKEMYGKVTPCINE